MPVPPNCTKPVEVGLCVRSRKVRRPILSTNTKPGSDRAMDVGVDGNGLEPISLDEVISLMKDREVKKLSLPKDHHERRL